jgi:heat shock protein 1/8
MISDAEKFKEDDDKNRERVDAKNDLENYLFSTKNTVNNTEMKLDDDSKKKINDIIAEKMSWLETNTTASTEEFKDIKKDVEESVAPILQGAMGAATGGMDGMMDGMAGMAGAPPPPPPETPIGEPTIEEID